MRRVPGIFCLIALLAAVAGCLERNETITLNPDGSGKSRMEVVFVKAMVGGVGGNSNVTGTVNAVIKATKGAYAWSDISCETDKDGKMHFKGTAYFKDIGKFSTSIGPQLHTTWTKGDNGVMKLTVTGPDLPKTGLPPAATQPGSTWVADRVKKLPEQWDRNRGQTATTYSRLKVTQIYLLPGEVGPTSILKPSATVPGGLELDIAGQKILDGMDKLMKDEAALTAAVTAGHMSSGKADLELTTKWLFGETGSVTAEVHGDLKPQFDFATEAAAAIKAEKKMYEDLGVIASQGTASKPALEGPLAPKPVE